MTQAADERDLRAGAPQAEWAAARRRGLQLDRGGRAMAFALAVFFAALFLFPMYWMIATSLKTLGDVFQVPPVWWPTTLMWQNYPTALHMFPFWRYAWNTVRITVPVTIGVTCSSALVAYSFSRLR